MPNHTLIFRALEFAARAHRGQYPKKTKIPCLVHPLAVAKLLIENGCSDEVVAAGILHDTVENTQTVSPRGLWVGFFMVLGAEY